VADSSQKEVGDTPVLKRGAEKLLPDPLTSPVTTMGRLGGARAQIPLERFSCLNANELSVLTREVRRSHARMEGLASMTVAEARELRKSTEAEARKKQEDVRDLVGSR
jgi:hypothetical protein